MRARARPAAALLALALAALALLGGCRAARPLSAAPEDLAAFRRVRTAPSLEERLTAASEYLAARPDGAFAPDVRRFLVRADEAYFASKRGSVAGLTAYLALLPAGPHAADAERELAALRAARVDLLGRSAAATDARLAELSRARARARDELSAWARRLAHPDLFAGSIADAPAELVVAWSLALPPPRCEAPGAGGARRCAKLVARELELPGAGRRTLLLEISVDEAPGQGICAARAAGPALFSRWEEASSLAPADAGVARERAVLAVTSLFRSAFEARSPGGCAELPGEGGRAFRCGDRVVTIVPASTPGADDRVEISRASPCPSP